MQTNAKTVKTVLAVALATAALSTGPALAMDNATVQQRAHLKALFAEARAKKAAGEVTFLGRLFGTEPQQQAKSAPTQ